MKKNNEKHYNIPIFIPHCGCPNDCVFCNQRKISGKQEFDINTVETEIKRCISSIYEKKEQVCAENVQIAYFGGSFTGINRSDMIFLLQTAKRYIDSGLVSSVRISTRPDYISGEILDILKLYGVRDIELGIQSMSDKVLRACKRGHSAEDSERACKLVKQYGFRLVGQMMVGLPCSTLENEIYTAKKICELGADGARIYPTVVLKETELARMYDRREYAPLSDEDAILHSSEVLSVFIKNKVPVIRIGLCAQDNLNTETDVYCGNYNAAVGESAVSKIYEKLLIERMEKLAAENGPLSGKKIMVFAPCGSTSKVLGQKKKNKDILMSRYGLKSLKVIENPDVIDYNVYITIE